MAGQPFSRGSDIREPGRRQDSHGQATAPGRTAAVMSCGVSLLRPSSGGAPGGSRTVLLLGARAPLLTLPQPRGRAHPEVLRDPFGSGPPPSGETPPLASLCPHLHTHAHAHTHTHTCSHALPDRHAGSSCSMDLELFPDGTTGVEKRGLVLHPVPRIARAPEGRQEAGRGNLTATTPHPPLGLPQGEGSGGRSPLLPCSQQGEENILLAELRSHLPGSSPHPSLPGLLLTWAGLNPSICTMGGSDAWE